MSAHHVLGVLEGEGPRAWETFDCAVGLAESTHAALTLAAATDPGRFTRWLAPAALQPMLLSPEDLDFVEIAGHALANMVEFVPADIPVTTWVLRQNTTSALIDLVRRGSYDTVVASGKLQRRGRIRRELMRLGVRPVVPSYQQSSRPAAASPRLEVRSRAVRGGDIPAWL